MLLIPVALLALCCPLTFAHPLSNFISLSTSNKSHQLDLVSRLRATLAQFTIKPSNLAAHGLNVPQVSSQGKQGLPRTFRERYDKDIVLRFNISSEDEAYSLAEAVDTLFLDVWDFTPVSADIRLAKDVVSVSVAHSPGRNLPLTSLGAFAVRAFAEVNANRTHTSDA